MEAELASSIKHSSIEKAFDRVVSMEKKAFMGALKCMYWMNKREMAHNEFFTSSGIVQDFWSHLP